MSFVGFSRHPPSHYFKRKLNRNGRFAWRYVDMRGFEASPEQAGSRKPQILKIVPRADRFLSFPCEAESNPSAVCLSKITIHDSPFIKLSLTSKKRKLYE